MANSSLTNSTTNIENILDIQFSYQPYEPKPRIISTQTSKGSFTESSNPLFTQGPNATIKFNYLTCGQAALDFIEMKRTPDSFIFKGALGDEYLIRFNSDFEVKSMKSGHWLFTGTFLVLCVTTLIDPTFGCS